VKHDHFWCGLLIIILVGIWSTAESRARRAEADLHTVAEQYRDAQLTIDVLRRQLTDELATGSPSDPEKRNP
jgi:hypothetical protein